MTDLDRPVEVKVFDETGDEVVRTIDNAEDLRAFLLVEFRTGYEYAKDAKDHELVAHIDKAVEVYASGDLYMAVAYLRLAKSFAFRSKAVLQ